MTNLRRGAAALLLVAGFAGVTGCSSGHAGTPLDREDAGDGVTVRGGAAGPVGERVIAGTATVDPAVVAEYRRKKTVRQAGLRACDAWVAGYTPRVAAHDSATMTSGVVKDSPSTAAFWSAVAPKLAAEYAAIATEIAALPSVITIAAPNPELVDVLTGYRTMLGDYRAAAQAAQAAAGSGPDMWGSTNQTYDTLTTHMNVRIVALCNTIRDA